MKAIILPTTNTGDLAPLTTWMPEFLIPVANKPVVEHLIELLARNHIQEILLIVKHMPYETERYFGDGSRWGVNLSYFPLGTYRGIADALNRLEASTREGTMLCLPADLVTDLDIAEFVNVARQGPWDICLADAGAGPDHHQLQEATAEELESLDSYPVLIKGKAFKSNILMEASGSRAGTAGGSGPEGGMAKAYRAPYNCHRIKSLAELAAANQLVLAGKFKSALIPGKLLKEGLWQGRNCQIHPAARLETPLLIGNHCNIMGGATIGPGSIIGDRVIIDQGASIRDSLVLSNTYVGPHTEIEKAIIKKNWMFQISRMLHVHMGDDLILGDLGKNTLEDRSIRLVNLTLALIIVILTAPIWFVMLFYNLIFPEKKLLFSQKRLQAYGPQGLGGETSPQTFDLFVFRSRNRFLSKIPGLINVIRGDLNLVGISPLDEEECRNLPDEWREMRAHAPLGLFHLWELEARNDLEWEEKMVIESYYAAARSTAWDMKIFCGAVLSAMRR